MSNTTRFIVTPATFFALLLALASAVHGQSVPSVTFAWNAPVLQPGQALAGYALERCALPPTATVCTCVPTLLAGVTIATTTTIDTPPAPGLYCYDVRSVAPDGTRSGPSTVLLVGVGLPPLLAPGPLQADVLLPRALLLATADSQETLAAQAQAAKVLDGSVSTIWHSQYTPTLAPLPHWVQIDLQGGLWWTSGLTVWPRQDTSPNGLIKDYRIEASPDGVTWTVLASGTWPSSRAPQTVRWAAVLTQAVRLVVLTNQSGNAYWASLAEVTVLGATQP